GSQTNMCYKRGVKGGKQIMTIIEIGTEPLGLEHLPGPTQRHPASALASVFLLFPSRSTLLSKPRCSHRYVCRLTISVRLSQYIRQLSNLQPIPLPSGPLLQTASGSNVRKALDRKSTRLNSSHRTISY